MPHRPLTFEVSRSDQGETRLAVSGEIDLNTAPDLEQTAADLLYERPKRLVLDLGEVPFCDSSGIGVLVRVYNKASVIGCRVVIARPTPNVRAILEMTALTRIFHIDDTPDPH
jgi:anti-sigma B factor antagonist